jgi:hypothetical protein
LSKWILRVPFRSLIMANAYFLPICGLGLWKSFVPNV